ncbi:hypothetical protein ACIGZJ_33370 [Kitasatospora sp. NPDC052868]|uniref:hypothetical protein n=1 Tax=Kitasatospora sp. NPDC052868 TaxID=3364060 RepID=UPI0037C9A727
MNNPSYWVYEGSRRRPGELASDPAHLPDNASPLYRPSSSPVQASSPGLDRASRRLAAADESEFPSLFGQLVSSSFGAVDQLHELLSTAADWCRNHDARQYGAELETLADRVADLGEELHLVNDSLGRELAARSNRLAAAVSRSPSRPPRPAPTSVAQAAAAREGARGPAPMPRSQPPIAAASPGRRRSP